MSNLEEVKLTGESKDIVSENISKLKEIFPDIFTEDKVDFDKLKLPAKLNCLEEINLKNIKIVKRFLLIFCLIFSFNFNFLEKNS